MPIILTDNDRDDLLVASYNGYQFDKLSHIQNIANLTALIATLPDGTQKDRASKLLTDSQARLIEVEANIARIQLPSEERVAAANLRLQAKAELEAQNLPEPPPEPETRVKNINGFNMALLNMIGMAAGNILLSKYPIYTPAIMAGNWTVTSQILNLAVANGDLTQEQLDAINILAAQCNLVD